MEYINIDERKEPTEMVWKQRRKEARKERGRDESIKKARERERKPTIFSILSKA